MKKLALLVLFFVTAICSAQTNERDMLHNKQGQAPSNITLEPKAIEYGEYLSQAVSNPGEKISVRRSEKILKMKLIFKAQKEIDECFIVYDDSTRTIKYLESKEQKEESSYYILFSIISIALMIILNVFELIERKINCQIISDTAINDMAIIIIAALTIGAGAVAVKVGAIIAAIAAGTGAFVALLNFSYPSTYCNGGSHTAHRLIMVAFYVLMAIHLVFIFL